MATALVSFSPTPPHTAMAGRRTPLASNKDAVNSPIRGIAALGRHQKRSHAMTQREDIYGQPPPTKKMMIDHGVSVSKSPTDPHRVDQSAAAAARAQRKQ